MSLLIVAAVALVASGLTLYSGFGLGTLLLPAFAFVFPIEWAVAATAIVHLANNLFKLALVGRHAALRIVLRFGLPAIPAAFFGAWLLGRLGERQALASGTWFGVDWTVRPLHLTIATLIALFALWDLIPAAKRPVLPGRALPVGGLFSGLFGGLSGHQGALRSAFLVHAGLDAKAYVGTGVACAVGVDLARLAVYGRQLAGLEWTRSHLLAVAVATLSAFLGAFLGSRWIGRVRVESLHTLVAWALIAIAIGMGAGWI